ncbi:MAG: ExeA family protein [Sulfuricella sp.]
MNQKLLALYGLKWNPFSPELPVEAIYVPPKIENFCWRIEHAQIREGGFAMIHGDPGSGKSIVLRLLAERLKKLPDITVGAINHPQSNLADFYRELGDIFAVPLRPSNRWGGFKALRERWFSHLESSRCRPVLLVDEAQEMTPQVLSELRLLASAHFDSQPLLCIVIAGDARLIEKRRREELIAACLAQPQQRGRKRQYPHEIEHFFLKSTKNSAIVLELTEHAFHNMPFLIEPPIARSLLFSVRF